MFFSRKLKRYIYSVITLSIVNSASTFAGAFQLWEESAASLGDYHAGAAAEANNASTIFYNPAGMSRIKHPQVSLGVVFIPVEVRFEGNVSLNGSVLNTATSKASGDVFVIVPNFHFVYPISNRWAIGFEETTPFGLMTKYKDPDPNNDFVNYLATTTELQTINLNPSVSYRVNRHLSLGVGFDALRGDATYNSVMLNSPLHNQLIGWGYGYNAGILWEFTPSTRAGMSYRSSIIIPGKGPSVYDPFGSPNKSTVTANFPLPATTMLSVYHDVNKKLAIMASAFYTEWSIFHTLVIHNVAQTSNTVTLALNENYKNTWNFAIGSRYRLNQHLSLEAGFGHDETPTSLPFRDIRSPDCDRYVASIGLNIRPQPNFEWNMGWTHLFTGSTAVDNSGSFNTSQSTLDPAIFPVGIGRVRSNINVFGIQFTWKV